VIKAVDNISQHQFFDKNSEESLKMLHVKLFLIYFPPSSSINFFHIIALNITIHESQ